MIYQKSHLDLEYLNVLNGKCLDMVPFSHFGIYELNIIIIIIIITVIIIIIIIISSSCIIIIISSSSSHQSSNHHHHHHHLIIISHLHGIMDLIIRDHPQHSIIEDITGNMNAMRHHMCTSILLLKWPIIFIIIKRYVHKVLN